MAIVPAQTRRLIAASKPARIVVPLLGGGKPRAPQPGSKSLAARGGLTGGGGAALAAPAAR
jgi:hypothetical protein